MLLSTLALLVGRLPNLAVDVVGIVLALVYRKRYPQPALLTLIACGSGILLALLGIGLTVGMQVAISRGNSVTATATAVGVVNIVLALVGAVAQGLLLWAIFGWRRAQQNIGENKL